MENELSEQAKRGNEIERLLINFKKEPQARRTQELNYKRLEKLNQLWLVFKKQDEEIGQVKEKFPEHPYITEHYYDQVKEAYKELLHLIMSSIYPAGTSGKSAKENPEGEEESTKKTSIVADPDQQKRFNKQRGMINALLSQISRTEDEMTQPQPKAFYTLKIKALAEYWTRLLSNHEDILANASDNDNDTEYLQSNLLGEIEDHYHQLAVKLQEQYDKKLDAPSTGEHQSSRLKLPKVNIPSFGGNYGQWQPFHDLYLQMVHKNEHIGSAQKMYYLKTNLSGEALKVIQHLQPTESNYSSAWQLLCDRYNNRRLLVATQLRALFAIPELKDASAMGIQNLHDKTKECLLALNNLKVNTENWDTFVVFLITQKLDKETHILYEQSLSSSKDLQTLDSVYNFLERRWQALEAVKEGAHNKKSDQQQTKGKQTMSRFSSGRFSSHYSTTDKCLVCDNKHVIYACDVFKDYSPRQRWDIVRAKHLCMNCLRPGHLIQHCPSFRNCRTCNGNHHTLLHTERSMHGVQVNCVGSSGKEEPTTKRKRKDSIAPINSNWRVNPDSMMARSAAKAYWAKSSRPMEQQEQKVQSHLAEDSTELSQQILLATALLNVKTELGQIGTLRALIDTGSQATFITEEAVQRLKLPKTKVYAKISGVGQAEAGTARSAVKVTIQPIYESQFSLTTTALVLKRLTHVLPNEQSKEDGWDHIQQLQLADPSYNKPSRIDMILGAEIYSEIILNGVIKGPKGSPIAQCTELGWILTGSIKQHEPKTVSCLIAVTQLEKQLTGFWECEELFPKRILTAEEQECEDHYEVTHTRQPDGTYEVHLPFKTNVNVALGKSQQRATARWLQMEKRLESNAELKKEYIEFIKEYINLGQMEQMHLLDTNDKSYYMPHHAVMKHDSTTTKLRVVFDASANTSTGVSLNDILMTGPRLQDELVSILMRWRKHKFVYSADIEKMYRQIKVVQEDRQYQRIVWRPTPAEQLKIYELNTVTYGTASAPYLAIKTLQTLAKDDRHIHPIAASIVLRDFYVDDVLSGSDTLETAIESQKQLTTLLRGGGFRLRKWTSNHTEILKNIPEELREKKCVISN